MSGEQTPIAAHALQGTPLFPQNPLRGPHMVTKMHVITDDTIKITTTQGEWIFAPTDVLTFPRRENGERKVWKSTDRMHAYELMVGDLLLPVEVQYPGNFEELPEHVQDNLRAMTFMQSWHVSQVVKGPASFRGVVQITFKRAGSPPLNVRIGYSDMITQPLIEMRQATVSTADVVKTALELYGPYVSRLSLPEERDRIFYFARHPYGRGRWPRDLANVDSGKVIGYVGDKPVEVRRPPHDFYDFYFQGSGTRHPKDKVDHLNKDTTLSEDEILKASLVAARYGL